MAQDILRDFALDASALSVMASLQAQLIEKDLAQESKNFIRKRAWYQKWLRLVTEGFEQMGATDKPVIWTTRGVDFEVAKRRLRESPDRLQAGLVLLEVAMFDAYWPFDKK